MKLEICILQLNPSLRSRAGSAAFMRIANRKLQIANCKLQADVHSITCLALPKYVPIEDGTFIDFMKQQKINYLFVERIIPEQQELIQQAVLSGSLEQIQGYLYALK